MFSEIFSAASSWSEYFVLVAAGSLVSSHCWNTFPSGVYGAGGNAPLPEVTEIVDVLSALPPRFPNVT